MGKSMGDLKAALMMIVVQGALAGVSISFKLASLWNEEGRSSSRGFFSVLIAYRCLFASAFLLPLAFFIDRKRKPKITGEVLFLAFLCGLFGATLQQNFFIQAVALAGATSATAMTNLVPGTTFILAVCFGLEKMKMGRSTGKAKVVGTILGIGGAMAMTMTFYKKIEIHLWSTHLNLMRHVAPQQVITPTNQIWGCASAFGTCLSASIWLILQAKMNEKFAWKYTSAALMSVMASIQSVIFALFMQADRNDWKLGWDIRLLLVSYTGIVGSGLVWILTTWCIALKGPLYASIFTPLFLVIVTIASSLIFAETLHLGSIIGFIMIVLGLYMVLWGKGKELKKLRDENDAAEGSHEGGDYSSSVKINISNHHHQHHEEEEEDGEAITTSSSDIVIIMNPGFSATLSTLFTTASSSDDLYTKQTQASTK